MAGAKGANMALARVGLSGAACLCVLLAACGGGGGSASPVAEVPTGLNAIARIEPYSRAGTLSSVTLRSAASNVERLAATSVVSLGSLSAAESARMAALRDAGASLGKAVPIGMSRAVAGLLDAAAFQRRLVWQPLPGGGQAAALALRSDGAAGIRLGLLVQRLPAGAVLRVYGASGPEFSATGQEVVAALALNAQAGDTSANGRTYWAPPVEGDLATLQIELPAGVDPSELALSLPTLSHLWSPPTMREAAAGSVQLKAAASTCEVDATCSPEYDVQARSVARLIFTEANVTYKCTGTLLADAGKTGTPWMLTANHCINTQTKANTLVTYWFYRSNACNSTTLYTGEQQQSQVGTRLRATDASTDTSFLQLSQQPPLSTVYAGSMLGPVDTGTALAGLHNPGGTTSVAGSDFLKLSLGSLSTYADCTATSTGVSCTDASDNSGAYLALRWSSGMTEEGSSGSAAFVTVGSQRYVVGHLYAGSTSCGSTVGRDFYGRFDKTYSTMLRQWLNP